MRLKRQGFRPAAATGGRGSPRGFGLALGVLGALALGLVQAGLSAAAGSVSFAAAVNYGAHTDPDAVAVGI